MQENTHCPISLAIVENIRYYRTIWTTPEQSGQQKSGKGGTQEGYGETEDKLNLISFCRQSNLIA